MIGRPLAYADQGRQDRPAARASAWRRKVVPPQTHAAARLSDSTVESLGIRSWSKRVTGAEVLHA